MVLLGIFDSLGEMISYIIVLIIVIMVIRVIIKLRKRAYKINHYWQMYFDDFAYSSQTFYFDVVEAIRRKEMPGVAVSQIKRYQSNILSPFREYLVIQRERHIFEVCAAPFGKGFFISSREGAQPGLRHTIILSIPIIGGYLAYLIYKKSFYQIDSQNMFASAVHHTVIEIAGKITGGKSGRVFTEPDNMMAAVTAQ